MPEPILLFVDIDGVISVADPGLPRYGIQKIHRTLQGAPVPLARSFLRAVDAAPWIVPVWISRWGSASQGWNLWAETALWPVALPLLEFSEKFPSNRAKPRANCEVVCQSRPHLRALAQQIETLSDRLALEYALEPEDKTLAAIVHSDRWTGKIVWIEDRLPPSAHKWAARDDRVTLMDTFPASATAHVDIGIREKNLGRILEQLELDFNLPAPCAEIFVADSPYASENDRHRLFSAVCGSIHWRDPSPAGSLSALD